MVIVVMGVSGAGKTTVGRALAAQLGWRFVDADDLHPRANVAKMARNEALTDDDREPWLQAVRQHIVNAAATRQPLVIACSALKRAYRRTLSDGLDKVRFVYLRTTAPELEARLATRPHHFAGPGLLASQLATLEEPSDEEALTLDASQPADTLVAQIVRALDV
jgi:carbohydrate kinase (thermoresistant glucokinase family)